MEAVFPTLTVSSLACVGVRAATHLTGRNVQSERKNRDKNVNIRVLMAESANTDTVNVHLHILVKCVNTVDLHTF